MALTTFVWCQKMQFDGVTFVLPISVRQSGQSDDIGHELQGLAANIANAAAVLPYIKTQVITFIQAHYGQTVTASDIAVQGAPL